VEPKLTVSEAAAFLGLSPQAIHKRIKSNGLAIQRKQNRFYFGYQTSKLLFKLNFPNKVWVFQNIKGGVGKTELTFCLAVRANLYGANVLCIDLDQQANLTKGCFRVDSRDKPIMLDVVKDGKPIEDTIINVLPGLDLIPSDLDNGVLDNALMLGLFPLDKIYKEKINKLKQSYDVILIDCPPALTASVAAATLASDEIIAPVTPDEHSLSGLRLLQQEIESLEEKYHASIALRVVFNMFDARNNLSHYKYRELLESPDYRGILYKTFIKKSQDFPNAISNSQSIFDAFRLTSAKEDIDLLTKEIFNIEQENKHANIHQSGIQASEHIHPLQAAS
jgi:chromosome partitioning protein